MKTKIQFLIAVLAGWQALVSPLRAQNPPTFLFEIDSSAVPGGFRPIGLTLDSSNNVCVTDYNNNRIIKLTAYGTYLTQWGSFGTNLGQFNTPIGVAADSSNNVYVTDEFNNRVEKFDGNGNYLTQWGSLGSGNSQFNGPFGVAVDRSNNVYVVDSGNNRFEKFTSNGNYVAQRGSLGSGSGQFNGPFGVAADGSNNVYVTDYHNNRVEKFDGNNGNYLTQWGSVGSGSGQFSGPYGIAVDGSGNFIYVADFSNYRIQVFVNNANIIPPIITNQPASQPVLAGVNVTFSVGVLGTAPLAYQWTSNNVAVPGATNATLTLTNVSLSESGGTYSVLVTNSYGSALSSHAMLTVVPATATYLFEIDSSAVPGGFQPNFVALDSSNNVYVTDINGDRVMKFDSNGTYLTQWGSYGSGNGQFYFPQGIAVDRSNNVYVVDQNNARVEKFDSNGNYLTQWGSYGTGNSQFSAPYGVAVDRSNNVYVADTYNDRIEKFDSNGNYLTQWGSFGTGNGQFSGPSGVAVDSGNNVYVADNGNDRVEKFDGNGNYLTQWGSSGSGNGQFNYPYGVAVDSNNNVYVADAGNNRVERFDSNGNYLTQWGSYGIGNGQFENPYGIAVDSSGNFIYVADFRIQVFVNNPNIVPPIITSQPMSQTVPAGVNVSFSVGVVGAMPLAYQWTSNNVAVPGATNATFTLTNVSLSNSGTYSLRVTNSYGSALSSPAVLTVLPAVVTTLPASGVSVTSAVLNGSVTVASDATGALFEWGADTNYGNIAGITIVPGNNGSNNISTTLNGLSADIYYHYRIVAANSFGTVYGNDQYFRADNPPTYLFEIDSSAVPFGFVPYYAAVDSSNNVYVTDESSKRVVKLSGGGTYLAQLGSYGIGNGQFQNPYGIAVDGSNNVYVTDTGNYRVEKFDGNGNYLTQWGSYGFSGNGQFQNPWGVAVDSSNDVYVTDNYNGIVQKFDSNGNYLTQWGSYGSAIAVDRGNNVYVTDVDDNAVVKSDGNGNVLTDWGGGGGGNGQFSEPWGIAVDSSTNVYVVDTSNDRVEKFDGNGNYLTQWGSYGFGNGQFYYPYGIAVDRTGNLIYVVDYGNNRIQVFANNVNILPPIITMPPVSQSVPVGANVTISVGVVGTAPFAYQWSSNNVALPGATNASITLNNVSLSASGSYSVLITNNYGSAVSISTLAVLPAVVITQPASGLSTTGAVLNGSVTVGPDETVAWFEWGTDTNFGNIAGITIVPGDSGTNGISAALTGLPGNFYHYRLVAANDYGIVYGNDQVFLVGSAPTVTTLKPVNASNGSTFNATVNPNGWDTTVFFRWARYGQPLTNLTQTIDVGAGANLLNVSSFITGLPPAAYCGCEAFASNHFGLRNGATVVFYSPPITSAPLADWQSVAVSADGSKIVAAANDTIPPTSPGVYISSDYGVTWIRATNGLLNGYFEAVASSADGTRLAAATTSGLMFTSTNSGTAWTRANNAPAADWNAIASSPDGTRLAAVALNVSGVYISTNSGLSWALQTNGLLPYTGITYVASSADGSKLVAASGASVNGPIFTSTNFGINWNQASNAPLARWYSVASSADGNTMLACAYLNGNVYLSTNAGASWANTSLPARNWNSVAESADGTKMVALANNNNQSPLSGGNGAIWTSTNSGVTWVSNNIPSAAWTCAAKSADGNELIAVVGNPSTTGGILVSQTTPSPVLSLARASGQFTLSWIIPSVNFGLQQSPDLSSWSVVTNVPVLNLTNLQNQVVLPPPVGNSFFRLQH